MKRIPPYIDYILHYYLMETFGQVACTARTRGTIRGPLISAESANEADSALHRLHSSILSDGDLRSGRVHGEDATHPFHGGHRRHDRGRYRRRSGCVVQPDIGDLRSGRVHGEDARHDRGFHGGHRRHDRKAQAARHLFYPLLGGGIAKRGGGLASTTPRFHPFFERTGQADGDLRSGRVSGEEARHNRDREGHRRRSGCVVQPDIGDLRSGRVLGLDATHPFHGGHRRHDRRAQAAQSGDH